VSEPEYFDDVWPGMQWAGTYTRADAAEIRSWRTLARVAVGDTLEARTVVESIGLSWRPGHGVVVQRVDVVNQHGHTVETGTLAKVLPKRSVEW